MARMVPFRMKFGRQEEWGRYLGSLMADNINHGYYANRVQLVIPIPLHWRRRLKRGFNQAQILAQPVANHLGKTLESRALFRVRATRPQARQSRQIRGAQMENVFQAQGCRIRGKRVLLIDDVMTTGSTVESASEAMLSAGAECVYIMVLSRISCYKSV